MDEQINDVFIWTFFGPAIATAFVILANPSLKPRGDSVILVTIFFATVTIVFIRNVISNCACMEVIVSFKHACDSD
jgi:hypothetical protein